MRYKVILTQSFFNTYDQVFDYIKNSWWESTVTEFNSLLWEKLDALEQFPESYNVYYLDERYRVFHLWGYSIFYKVNKPKHEISIFFIFHGSQNLSKLL